MTTTVKVSACVAPEKEVKVRLTGTNMPDEEITLQNGETAERYIYDDREISVREVVKVPEQPPCDNAHVAEGCEQFE